MRRSGWLLAVVYLMIACGAANASKPPTVRSGDVVFQISKSRQTIPIQRATGSSWSHCGVVFVIDSAPVVCEAVGPVKFTPLDEWIEDGVGQEYAVMRLRPEFALTRDSMVLMRRAADRFLGRPYDHLYAWSDAKLYCSELVHKVYRAAGVKIGMPRALRAFGIADPVVRAALAGKYGKAIPLDEPMIAPGDLFRDARFIEVKQ